MAPISEISVLSFESGLIICIYNKLPAPLAATQCCWAAPLRLTLKDPCERGKVRRSTSQEHFRSSIKGENNFLRLRSIQGSEAYRVHPAGSIREWLSVSISCLCPKRSRALKRIPWSQENTWVLLTHITNRDQTPSCLSLFEILCAEGPLMSRPNNPETGCPSSCNGLRH